MHTYALVRYAPNVIDIDLSGFARSPLTVESIYARWLLADRFAAEDINREFVTNVLRIELDGEDLCDTGYCLLGMAYDADTLHRCRLFATGKQRDKLTVELRQVVHEARGILESAVGPASVAPWAKRWSPVAGLAGLLQDWDAFRADAAMTAMGGRQ